jgi:alpha-ketoglutarate-dependent taurine dioxygenase
VSIEIIPTGAALGAQVSGVDLAQSPDDATFATIERAYNDHGVIFFRDQHITPPQQVAFTRRFGEIEFNIFGERWSVPGSPEIVVVSNVTKDGRPIGVRRAGENWHSDMCYAARPPALAIASATCLSMVAVSPECLFGTLAPSHYDIPDGGGLQPALTLSWIS